MTTDYIDPRIIRTRQALGDALARLSAQRGYENLTIQAVTDEAKLGYASFHRHFRSLDELLASLILPAWNTLKRRVSEQETCQDESLALFRFVKEHQDLYRIYLGLPRDHPLRQAIDQETRALFIARYERLNDTKVPFDFSVMIVEAVTERLIRRYLDNIDKYRPEEMADMHYDIAVQSALNTMKLREGWVLAPRF